MTDISISSGIKQSCPHVRLGVICSDIKYEKKNSELWHVIKGAAEQIENSLNQDQITNLLVIRHTREAYLALVVFPR